jgi:hypothetical protein
MSEDEDEMPDPLIGMVCDTELWCPGIPSVLVRVKDGIKDLFLSYIVDTYPFYGVQIGSIWIATCNAEIIADADHDGIIFSNNFSAEDIESDEFLNAAGRLITDFYNPGLKALSKVHYCGTVSRAGRSAPSHKTKCAYFIVMPDNQFRIVKPKSESVKDLIANAIEDIKALGGMVFVENLTHLVFGVDYYLGVEGATKRDLRVILHEAGISTCMKDKSFVHDPPKAALQAKRIFSYNRKIKKKRQADFESKEEPINAWLMFIRDIRSEIHRFFYTDRNISFQMVLLFWSDIYGYGAWRSLESYINIKKKLKKETFGTGLKAHMSEEYEWLIEDIKNPAINKDLKIRKHSIFATRLCAELFTRRTRTSQPS